MTQREIIFRVTILHRYFGFMSQICNEVNPDRLQHASHEFIIKTGSEFYKTLSMR